MSASDSSLPNHEKYHASEVATTKSAARIRIGRLPLPVISGRINLVKHKINDHAGDRHVEPKRQRDPRDASMSREVLAESAIESNDDEWNDHDREDRVRGQDRKVDGP